MWNTLPKWVRDLRAENASWRTKLRETEADLNTTREKLTEYQQRDMTELQKAQATAQQLEQSLTTTQQQLRTVQVQSASYELGIVDPDIAEKLIDWDAVKNGKSVKEALAEIVEQKPYLKGTGQQGGTGTGGGTSEGGATNTGKSEAARPADTKTSAGTPSSQTQGEPKTFKRSEIQKLAADDPDAFNELYDKGGLKEAMEAGRLINDVK